MKKRTTICPYCHFTGVLDGDVPCPCPRGDRFRGDRIRHENLRSIKETRRRREIPSQIPPPVADHTRKGLLRFLLGEHPD